MTPAEFSRWTANKQRELEKLMRHVLPKVVGRMAMDHFQDNFYKGGFVNGGLHPWKPAKRLSSGLRGAAYRYGTLLSGDKHLFNSIKYIPGEGRVKVSNDMRYAPIHNWGGTVNPTVTDKMRRHAWYMYYKSIGKKKKTAKGKKKGGSTATPENTQAQFWKRLALTKKSKLNVKMPQRQFLGESAELSEKIAAVRESEIRKILNS